MVREHVIPLRRSAWTVVGLWLLTWCASCHREPALEANDAVLAGLMSQRLELARDVAWTKFNTGASVLDAPREQAVLADLVARSVRAGVDQQAASIFFTAQIAASRQVQTELIDDWQRGKPRPTSAPVDLVAVIRPRLDSISEKLVGALAARRPTAAPRATIQAALAARGFSDAVAKLAADGLR